MKKGDNMNINILHYKILSEPEKVYIDTSTVKLREKLNKELKNPVPSDGSRGICGKYSKKEKIYKIRYFNKRNKQFQPQTFNKFYYLLDIDTDEKGTYAEYVMVCDKLYEPLIRTVYVLAVGAVLGYLYYSYYVKATDLFSTLVLGIIVSLSALVVFKKSNETAEDSQKAHEFIKKLLSDIKF